MDYEHWQRRWDLQQESYMPDREQRFAAMLDVVQVACGSAPRILDLACGTGSITRRVLARFPSATSVLVDIDPALLAIASGTFQSDPRVRIATADLSSGNWRRALPADIGPLDAVLTATALHWLVPGRVAQLYAEVRTLLREGGVLANVDHMPDAGLEAIDAGLAALEGEQSADFRARRGVPDWDGWWRELAEEPEMAPLVDARSALFAHGGNAAHTQSSMPSDWHVSALRDAGYRSAGVAWRALRDALVVGLA